MFPLRLQKTQRKVRENCKNKSLEFREKSREIQNGKFLATLDLTLLTQATTLLSKTSHAYFSL